jgi:regulator of Ty1 transposition protein 109
MTVSNKNTTINVINNLSIILKEQSSYIIFNGFTTKRCVPVIHKSENSRPLLSTKTTHYCILFSANKIPLLAIEIFTYLSFYKSHVDKLVYVSKADTTGLEGSSYVNVGAFVTEYLRIVCEISVHQLLANLTSNARKECAKKINLQHDRIFMSETQFGLYILEQRSSGDVNFNMPANANKINVTDYISSFGVDPKILDSYIIPTKLVLFTRSEGQYLFPESMKNSGKHILDGSKLLKWWLKNIEKVISDKWTNPKKFLDVLNLENREIQRYFPNNGWSVGNVYTDSSNINDPAIYHIPLLPDDPKGRFLEHLVVEGRAKKVNASRYWQELAIRQEFRFGAIVGLIGVSVDIPTTIKQTENMNYVSNKDYRTITELINTKDYSDKSDWSLLFDDIKMLNIMKPYEIIGSFKPQKREIETVSPTVNTLLCVRKKKK